MPPTRVTQAWPAAHPAAGDPAALVDLPGLPELDVDTTRLFVGLGLTVFGGGLAILSSGLTPRLLGAGLGAGGIFVAVSGVRATAPAETRLGFTGPPQVQVLLNGAPLQPGVSVQPRDVLTFDYRWTAENPAERELTAGPRLEVVADRQGILGLPLRDTTLVLVEPDGSVSSEADAALTGTPLVERATLLPGESGQVRIRVSLEARAALATEQLTGFQGWFAKVAIVNLDADRDVVERRLDDLFQLTRPRGPRLTAPNGAQPRLSLDVAR